MSWQSIKKYIVIEYYEYKIFTINTLRSNCVRVRIFFYATLMMQLLTYLHTEQNKEESYPERNKLCDSNAYSQDHIWYEPKWWKRLLGKID